MNNDNITLKCKVLARESVRLPGEDYVIHSWKIKAGSPVQKGETVALAMEKNNASQVTDLTSESGATPVAAVPSMASHKRPKRRRRGGAAAAAAVVSTTSTNTPPTTSAPTAAGKTGDNNSSSFISLITAKKPDTATARPLSNIVADTVPIVAPMDGLWQLGDGSDKLVIGFVEECSHPAVMMGGLCVICGKKVNQHNDDNHNSSSMPTSPLHYDQSSQAQNNQMSKSQQQQQQQRVTVSGGITMTLTEQEAQAMAKQTSKRMLDQRKLSLVLDLDHTLVHATADARATAYVGAGSDVRTLLLPMTEGTPQNNQQPPQVRMIKHFAKLRPHIKEFLASASERYELSVYTAGTRLYAEQITMVLCRYMIGADRDQEDLEHLRYGLFIAEQNLSKHRHHQKQLDQQQQQQKDKIENIKEEAEAEEKKSSENGEKNGTDANEESKKDSDEPPTKKRKKVSFGEPPASLKTDQIDTPEEKVEKLKQELEEAERLESLAMDLRKRLFGSRIVSRTDVGDLGRDVKSLKRIFPCGGTMAAIVDDREDVWAKASDNTVARPGEPPENLLLVRPYHWKPFLGFADVNNAAGKVDVAGAEEDRPEEEVESDEQLLWTGDILERLHTRFYDKEMSEEVQHQRTVPSILQTMRNEVLNGCHLVLSGLIPLHKQQREQTNKLPRPSVLRYAENLGAKILDNVTPRVTHVVAARDGTDKTNRARQIPGCAVVKASWLMECVWSVTKRDVLHHYLGKAPIAKPPITKDTKTNSTMTNSDSNSSSDEDSDGFAADFEQQMMDEM